MPTKPKNSSKDTSRDNCQTPPYALEPLLPYLEYTQSPFWDCACGEMIISRWVQDHHYLCAYTDIKLGGYDFLEMYQTGYSIITNPPYSLKYKFLEHAIELGVAFAMLMPTDTMQSATGQKLIFENDIQILLPDRRINYKMPVDGWGGQAQFHSSWFTHGFGVERMIERVHLDHSWEIPYRKERARLKKLHPDAQEYKRQLQMSEFLHTP